MSSRPEASGSKSKCLKISTCGRNGLASLRLVDLNKIPAEAFGQDGMSSLPEASGSKCR